MQPSMMFESCELELLEPETNWKVHEIRCRANYHVHRGLVKMRTSINSLNELTLLLI